MYIYLLAIAWQPKLSIDKLPATLFYVMGMGVDDHNYGRLMMKGVIVQQTIIYLSLIGVHSIMHACTPIRACTCSYYIHTCTCTCTLLHNIFIMIDN